MNLKDSIRSIPDFPEPGIIFRDITTLLKEPKALKESIKQMQQPLEELSFDSIIGAESRGFIFGMPIAYNLEKGFIPVRKAGKLPSATIRKEYQLEYGTATIEMHKDAITPGQRVVIIDDLLATGGTAKAMVEMVEEAGGIVVALAFLIELEKLNGREKLEGKKVFSIMQY